MFYDLSETALFTPTTKHDLLVIISFGRCTNFSTSTKTFFGRCNIIDINEENFVTLDFVFCYSALNLNGDWNVSNISKQTRKRSQPVVAKHHHNLQFSMCWKTFNYFLLNFQFSQKSSTYSTVPFHNHNTKTAVSIRNAFEGKNLNEAK